MRAVVGARFTRFTDAELYALAKYLYSLEPLPSPYEFDEETLALGERVFIEEGCVTCHPRREYFHVERYGEVELRSIRLERSGEAFAGAFLLRIRDVERVVEIPFAFDSSGSRARLSGRLSLDRLDYGLGKRSLILGDVVTVEVALELVPAAGGSSDPCHGPRWTGEAPSPSRGRWGPTQPASSSGRMYQRSVQPSSSSPSAMMPE